MGDVDHLDERVGDLELLERVRGGDARAANELIARHLEAVRALGADEPVAAGREVLRRVVGGARLGMPFRAAWLAALAGSPGSEAPVWAAYLALPADAQLAIWHHEVEGEHPQVVGMHLGVGRREVDAVLASSYDGLGVAPGEGLRVALAVAVLGERAEDYLARRRPEPVEGRTAAVGRAPALVMVGAGLAVAAVTASALVTGVTAPTDPDGPLAAAQVVTPGRVIEAEVRRPAAPREAVAVVRPAVAPPAGPPAAAPQLEVQEVGVPVPTEDPPQEPPQDPAPVERPEPPVVADEARLVDVGLSTGTVTVDAGLPTGPLVVQLPIAVGGR